MLKIPSPSSGQRLFIEIALVFLLGVFIALIGLNNHEFVEFESRFGLFAQEMLRNGISFFPTTYNHFYPDYPATQTILTYLFSLPFGKVTILTAVLPSAIASGITLVFTYLIGLTQSKRWGLYAVLFTLFTFAFLAAARTISIDQFSAAATVASFYYVYTAELYKKPQRLWLIPICLLLGFAFRGPIGLIIPAAVVSGFYLLEKEYKKLLITLLSSALLLFVCLLALLSAAWHEGGKEFMRSVMQMQIMGRMKTTSAPPFYYYLGVLFTSYALSFYIACLVVSVYAKTLWRTSQDQTLRLLRHLSFWVLIVIIGMSIPGDKKVRYVLAIAPALALIAAYLMIGLHAAQLLQRIRSALIKICTVLPYVGVILISICVINEKTQNLSLGKYFLVAILLFGIQIIITNVWIKRLDSDHTTQRELSSFIIGLTAFMTMYICIAQPIDIALNQAKPFVTQIETLRNSQQALVFYGIGPDGDDIKYMVALDKPLQPQFVQTPVELANFKTPAIFIAPIEKFAALPGDVKINFRILFVGNLGHSRCVVFTLLPTAPTNSLMPRV